MADGRGAGTRWLRRWRWLAGPVLVGLLPFLVVVATSLANVDRLGIQRGDYALIELATRSAGRGHRTLGPYSRFGWNHPGPVLFLWYAPFARLFDQAPESLGLAAAVANALGMATAIAASGLASGRRAAWTVAAGSLLLVGVWSFSWIDRIWNPFVVLVPLVALAFLAAGTVAGRRWMLLGVVATGSFATQSHVGTAPVVALFLLATVVAVALDRPGGWRATARRWVGPVLAAAVLGGALWAPTVHEELTGHPGNLTEIARFLDANQGDHGLREVLDQEAVQLTATKVQLLPNVVSPTRPLPPATPPRLVLLGGLLAAALVGHVRNRRRGRPFEAHLCLLAVVGTVGAVVGGMRVVGELEGYLTLPAAAVGAVLWAAVGLTVAAEVAARERRHPVPGFGRGAAVRVAWLGALVATTLVARQPGRALQLPVHPDRSGLALADAVRRAIPDGTDSVRLEPARGALSTAAMVANQIELDGTDVHVAADQTVYFGPERLVDGCEALVVQVGRPDQLDEVGDLPVVGTSRRIEVRIGPLAPADRCE